MKFIDNLSFSFRIIEIILIIITPMEAPKVLSIKSVILGNPIVKIYWVDSYIKLNINPKIIALKPDDLGYSILI